MPPKIPVPAPKPSPKVAVPPAPAGGSKVGQRPPKSGGDDASLDALLDSAMDSFDKKQAEIAAQPAPAPAVTPSTPDDTQLLELVQTLFQRLLADPNYDPGFSSQEEKDLERVVSEGLKALQTGEGKQEEAALAQSVEMLKNVLGKSGNSAPPAGGQPTPAHDPEMQQKIDELLHSLSAALYDADGVPPGSAKPSNPDAAAAAMELQAQQIAHALSSDMVAKPFKWMQDACPLWLEKYSLTAPPQEVEVIQHHFKIITELVEIYDTDPLFRPIDCVPRDSHQGAVTPEEISRSQTSLDRVVNLIQSLHDKGEPPETFTAIVQDLQAKSIELERMPHAPPSS